MLSLCCPPALFSAAQIVRPSAFDNFRNFVKWRDTGSRVWVCACDAEAPACDLVQQHCPFEHDLSCCAPFPPAHHLSSPVVPDLPQ